MVAVEERQIITYPASVPAIYEALAKSEGVSGHPLIFNKSGFS